MLTAVEIESKGVGGGEVRLLFRRSDRTQRMRTTMRGLYHRISLSPDLV